MSPYTYYMYRAGLKHAIECDREELAAVFELFTMKDEEYPNGTSFAVSSEPTSGRMRVYMSDASHKRYLEAIQEQLGESHNVQIIEVKDRNGRHDS